MLKQFMGSNGPAMTKRVIIGVYVILFLGSLASAAYFFKQYNDLKKNPNKLVQEETKSVVDAVGKLLVLPQNEQPTLATVSDPEKLKDQPFFANAKKGFRVLIYTNAKKAILYDPISDKIVEVAPINIGNNAAAPTAKDEAAKDAAADTKK